MRSSRAAANTVLFETINVSKSFGAFKALSDVSFQLSDGEFVSIVGPNGAGKTTLVNVVTGLLRPTAGEVRFLGRDIAGIGPVELARFGMARSFQLVNIFPALTVRETLAVAVASRLRRLSNPFRSLHAMMCCRPTSSELLMSSVCARGSRRWLRRCRRAKRNCWISPARLRSIRP